LNRPCIDTFTKKILNLNQLIFIKKVNRNGFLSEIIGKKFNASIVVYDQKMKTKFFYNLIVILSSGPSTENRTVLKFMD
jgi:hypothetical protein